MRSGPLLLAIALLARPAAAEDGGVSAEAALHLRLTSTRNVPGTEVLFDPPTRAFDLDGYLVTAGSEAYGSTLASVRLSGRLLGGDLRWVIAADTGELRSERFPELAAVCPSTDPTGLAVRGSRRCDLGPATWPVESTVPGPAGATANGRPLRVEAERTLFVREAYAAWSFGRAGFATVRAGKRRTTVADGFVYDDYATGVEADLDLGALGPQWEVAAGLFQPTRDLPWTVDGLSPMAYLRVDWLPSLFEHAGVFAAALRDRTGSMGEVFRSTVVERAVAALDEVPSGTREARSAARLLAATLSAPLESDASLGWAGTSGALVPLRGSRLRWTAAVVSGTVHRIAVAEAGRPPAVQDLALRGRMLSLGWDAGLPGRVTAGAFFLYLSGGEFPRRTRDPATGEVLPASGTYRGFVGVAPFITATNLFFGGGLSESFASRQISTPGENGRGVIAPGVSLAWDPAEAWTAQAKAAWLRADAAGPLGGLVYGTEVDLELTWSPRRWLVVGIEADALWPGDFFYGGRTLTKALLAVDLLTP